MDYELWVKDGKRKKTLGCGRSHGGRVAEGGMEDRSVRRLWDWPKHRAKGGKWVREATMERWKVGGLVGCEQTPPRSAEAPVGRAERLPNRVSAERESKEWRMD